MKLPLKYSNIIVETICALFVMLFVYAAVSKLSEFQNFRAQLGQSPIISAYTGIISIAVPVLEIGIAFLLVIPRLRMLGLFSAVSLMILFTGYILIILNLSSYVPCSCGGILEHMGWTEHLIFNLIFVLLGIIALVLLRHSNSFPVSELLWRKYYIPVGLLFVTVLNASLLFYLYYSSEYTMEKNNPFIRRFIQGSAVRSGAYLLPNNLYYFAGKGNGKIYLANTAAPLYITEIDTALQIRKRYKIELDNYKYPFKNVQVQVRPPFFYLMDGTVPIIFKGNISDWKGAGTTSVPYFSKAENTSPNSFTYRGVDKDHAYFLGQFSIGKQTLNIIKKGLLKKQIDGFFDCDGMLHYDVEQKQLIYLYYYRNQFLVADSALNLRQESRTIDTTEHARLKVAHIKDLGERKLAAPPYIVNIMSTTAQDRLFVNSAIIGRFEDRDMWKNASIVDIYDITHKKYLSSIYIYNKNKLKMDDMMLSGSNLYVLTGQHLERYKLSKKIAGALPER